MLACTLARCQGRFITVPAKALYSASEFKHAGLKALRAQSHKQHTDSPLCKQLGILLLMPHRPGSASACEKASIRVDPEFKAYKSMG